MISVIDPRDLHQLVSIFDTHSMYDEMENGVLPSRQLYQIGFDAAYNSVKDPMHKPIDAACASTIAGTHMYKPDQPDPHHEADLRRLRELDAMPATGYTHNPNL